MPVVLDTNSKYCVQIEQFEGPLDLLLHLVREAKLDITEISLAAVANQYFEYLEKMKSFNIEIESGEGCYLKDTNGKEYLDLTSGIGVNCLGHNHPVLVPAIQKQVATLMECSNLY